MKEFNCPDCNYVNSCKECFRFKNYIKQSNIEKENKENKKNKENIKEDSTDIKTTEIKINYIPVSYPTCPFLTNYPYYPYFSYYPDYYFDTSTSAIPPSCRCCPNHPSNGGTGICNCILGTPSIY